MDYWTKVSAIAQVALAVLTLILAGVAIFQETVRGWFYRSRLALSVVCAPPDCVAVPIFNLRTGEAADAVFLRVNVSNTGNATAINAEVYARELRQRRADSTWERVPTFPPMNLKWANLGGTIYFPRIAPGMGKACDVAHITSPGERGKIYESVPAAVDQQRTALVFELQAAPNHLGHIVGPGTYRLDLLVAAENAAPRAYTLEINLTGEWFKDETRMLRAGVGIRIVTP